MLAGGWAGGWQQAKSTEGYDGERTLTGGEEEEMQWYSATWAGDNLRDTEAQSALVEWDAYLTLEGTQPFKDRSHPKNPKWKAKVTIAGAP